MSAHPKNTRQATSHIAPFGVRMQPALKEQLEKAAQASGRSLNVEITSRLEASLTTSDSNAPYLEAELLARQLDMSDIAKTISTVLEQLTGDDKDSAIALASLRRLRRSTARYALPDDVVENLNQEHQGKLSEVLTSIKNRVSRNL